MKNHDYTRLIDENWDTLGIRDKLSSHPAEVPAAALKTHNRILMNNAISLSKGSTYCEYGRTSNKNKEPRKWFDAKICGLQSVKLCFLTE